MSYSHTQHTWVFILTPIFSVIILIQATPREPPERQLLQVSYSHTQHTWVFILTPILSVIIFKQPLGSPERQLLHVSYSHTQHTWVFILTPIFSVIILIQATPREPPRAAIASSVLLTYPAHLGIHSHAYLLCHYPNSSNPSGAPSGNCFTCLTHIPSTPGYSYLLCHYSNSSNPSGAPRAAIASHVLLTYPAHLGIHSHAYLLCHYPNSSNPSGAPSGNCFTCLTHIPSTPGYSYLLCHYSNSSNPSGAPRAAIASHVLLTYPAHLGIHSHAYLLCHYPNSSNPSGAPSGNCFTCLTHIPSTPGYSYFLCHYSNSSNPSGAPQAAIASHVLLTYPAHLGIHSHAYLLCHYPNSSNPSGP